MNAMKASCGKCGGPMIWGGVTTRYRYCPPCTRARAAARRSRAAYHPLPLDGARERLRTYLAHSDPAVLDRIAALLERNADYTGQSVAELFRARIAA